MTVYNLTELNDADNATGWTDSNKAPALNTTAGQRYEGSGSIETQHTNTAGGDELDTAQTSGGGGTFSIDLSDSTVYYQFKDNLVDTYANQGVMAVLGDGTDLVGFQMGGNNAPGMFVPPFYNSYKFDASNLPSGSNTTFAGTEGNLTLTTITRVGVGTVHLAKAVGNVANVFCDRISYIANDSYALTINGGTVGTPETMADVAGDDITNGWGLIANPLGDQYQFFAPTEWGESSASANHYFTADNQQWFFMGDNAGGHAVGATHFPFRLVSNATDTGLWQVMNCAIISTGTPAELYMDDANFDTIEMDGCTLTNFDEVWLPSSGGTSRYTTNNIFNSCAQITNNGADMDGCSILLSTVAADIGALLYNEASDPDGTLDNLTISKGTAAHHAIDFGTNVDSSLTSITLRGIEFTGFGATDDSNDSTVRFLATTGTLTLNLIDCTVDGISPVASGGSQNFSVDDAAGITVTVVVQPVTLTVTVRDSVSLALLTSVQTSIFLKDSPFTQLMNEDTVAGVASESYAGSTPVDIVYKCRKSEDTDSPRYQAFSGIAQITSSGFSATVLLEQNPFI
jgi:hypothetical protein